VTSNWFWWGKPFTTKEEFIQLWRFTVEYLRDEKEVRNIIFALSPDRYFSSEEEYLERYPGGPLETTLGGGKWGKTRLCQTFRAFRGKNEAHICPRIDDFGKTY
jgi:hypothetical protein